MALWSPIRSYRLVILGDESVGKTNIFIRFMYDKFDPTYQATNGIDFMSKTVYHEDRTVRLQLWDTAGRERFRSLIPSYIRGSSFSVIVYDVTNRQSFLNISWWIEQVHKEQGSNAIIVLVGNKTDLVDERKVSIKEGNIKAREFGAMFVETSAKDGFNIKLVFSSLKLHAEEQDFQPQHRQLELLAPQTSSSGNSLEEIEKNLTITEASFKTLEKTIEQLVASIENLEAKERFPSQIEVNPKQNNL